MAMYENYINLDSRRESFPKNFPIQEITAHEFSEAGFFFGGIGDRTKCFFCGVGLTNWNDIDDPWKQHAKFSPNCVYLEDRMGNEFLSRICRVKILEQNDYDRNIYGIKKFAQSSDFNNCKGHEVIKYT